MYFLYSFLLSLALTLLLPIYFIKLRLGKGETLGLRQRLAISPPRPAASSRSLWLHAVSVGEVLSLQKLVGEIKACHPEWAVYFSVLTNAGLKIARQKMTACDRIFTFPFDFGWAMRRCLRSLKPDLLVLAESELWPNLLRQARCRTKGILVINGRVSDRSFGRYRRMPFLAGRLFGAVTRFLVQTEQDQERLIQAGVEESRLEVAGNLKCEILPPAFTADALGALRQELALPADARILVAGSTREGEEEQLLRAFAEARREAPNVFLIIAPRHMGRVREVEKACRQAGFSVKKRTGVGEGGTWDVLLLDTIGELARVYALGDAAFIGGSLVPWGGHNLLEPAAFGKPIYFGPHMNNFSDLAQKFLRSGGARQVSGPEDLKAMFLFRDRAGLERMGQQARRTLDSLQGATERTLRVIESMMAG